VRRLLGPFPLAAAVALLCGIQLTACAAADPPAATIAADASSSPYFTLAAKELWDEVNKSRGPGATTAMTDVMAVTQIINGRVRTALIDQLLKDRNITPTKEDEDAANEQVQGSSQGMPDPEQVKATAAVNALSRDLADKFFAQPGNDIEPFARQFYEQRKDQLQTPAQTCLHILLVSLASQQPTDADYAAALPKAQDYRRRLDSEPFEKVADESQAGADEPIPGGDLKCRADSTLPEDVMPAIAQVPTGTTSQPLKWRGGWVIAHVDDRKASRLPAFEEIRPQVLERTKQEFGQRFANELLAKTSKNSAVHIDPRFGRWDPEQAQVLPPQGAANPTTPTTVPAVAPLDEGQNAPSGAPAAPAAP
jgi:parvulin-like peptidyl-prolyl isomerase